MADKAEAVRGADGSWRVAGDEADIEGLRAARARVLALEAELGAQAEVTAQATAEAAQARADLEAMADQVKALQGVRDVLQGQVDDLVGERDRLQVDAQAQAAELASKNSEIMGLTRRIEADALRLLKREGRAAADAGEGRAEA